jgi:general secretion pathway protein D
MKNNNGLVRAVIIALALLLIFHASSQGQSQKNKSHPKTDKINLQYKDADVVDIFRNLSETTGTNIVVESGVRGNITIFLDDVSFQEALDLITSMNGLAYVMSKNTVMIYTAQKYEQLYGQKFQNLIEKREIRLNNINASQMAGYLSPLKSKDGNIVINPRNNSLIIYDMPGSISQMEELAGRLDVPQASRSFEIKYLLPSKLKTLLSPYISSEGVIIDDDAHKLLYIYDSETSLQQVASLIQSYDIPPVVISETFKLNYAKANDISANITTLLTPGVGTIKTDIENNNLIVWDLPENIVSIEKLIKTYDQKIEQVLIEAQIMQVSLNDNIKTGIDWEVVTNKINEVSDLNITANFGVLPEGSEGIVFTGGELSENNYTAVVELLQTYGSTNLLSSPRLMAINKNEASILVGSTVPYKTIDTREENGAIRTFEKISMIDVGVKLFVTPVINADSLIKIDIRPEVSSVIGYSENIPVVEKSEMQTHVFVKSGDTVLIGGLMREEKQNTSNGIPLICRIPILGNFFRSNSIKKTKTELVILLTPRITSGEYAVEQQ